MLTTQLNGRTPDLTAENIEKLKTLFPEIITEGKIDFDKLKLILGDAVETDNERYNFTWHGKAKALRLSQTPSTGTLRPCKEESKDWDSTQNLYIEGDNLEVLKMLQKSYHGKVKMIYIDPPYNTGNDFVYPDDFKDNIENYKEITGQVDSEGNNLSTNSEASGRYHTDWLNMMYPRLRLARNLLSDDGVIFISIDDNEVDNLKKICNEVFGEENFVGTLILQTATDNNPRQINVEHEYIVCYAKRFSDLSPWQEESEKAKLIINKYEQLKNQTNDIDVIQLNLRKWINENKDNLEGVTHYDNVDEKGVFHDGDIANTVFGGYKYEIIHPATGKPCKIPDKGFRFAETTMRSMIENNDIMFGNDETTLIKPKKRIENAKDILRSVIYEDGRASTKRFEQLMSRDIFQNPKSDTIIQRLINFTTSQNDIILDFFSGSATTAHSVLSQNANRNLNLKYIMVQLPENLDYMLANANSRAKKTICNAIEFLDSINKPHNICEIGKERIRRAGDKIKDEKGLMAQNLDIGFKVFKLDSSNIRKWQPDYDNLERSLEDFVSNYVDGRTEFDILYEIMLKYGLDLTCPVEQHDIGGKKVYSIGMGMLMICLDNDITTDVAKGILKLKEELKPESLRVVFKDNGFHSDSNKTNIKEILKVGGVDEFVTV